ncbi:DUF418 domain-containing protein [uncultured Tessaracoccus sp.]|uniref:DUF418 domain-containing protein n=1 Tax=uncultured Tessaracoccus sp. TaxID=905023 RepID=UPI00262159ED|nr:DUF418 domain-containing protein [uncultured Tessaracoccus sp.]
MIVVHMASLVWSTKVILSGLPAALFAVIAGITLMIIGRDYTVTTFMRLIARGCIITLLGLALLPLGGQIQVVLVAMGITMIMVSWVPALGVWWKLALFVAATAGATIRYTPSTLPEIYPLLAWVAYFLGGMLLYEVYIHQRNRALRWTCTGASAVVAAVGLYLRFKADIPAWLRFTGHTGVLGEILLSVAASAVVLHLCLLVGEHAAKLATPFAAMGTMSLSVYILHVLTAYYWQQHVAIHNTVWAVAFVGFFLVVCSVWKQFVGQGPAEWGVAKLIRIVVPAGKKA